MANRNILPWTILGIAGLYVGYNLTKAHVAQSLNFSIKSVEPSFSGFNLNLKINVAISNPTANNLTVNGIAGVIYVNGNQAGTVQTSQIMTIQPVGVSVYPFNVSISLLGIGLDIANIIQGKTPLQCVIRLLGNVIAEGLNFPIDLTYKII